MFGFVVLSNAIAPYPCASESDTGTSNFKDSNDANIDLYLGHRLKHDWASESTWI